jgi:hypothetical protein
MQRIGTVIIHAAVDSHFLVGLRHMKLILTHLAWMDGKPDSRFAKKKLIRPGSFHFLNMFKRTFFLMPFIVAVEVGSNPVKAGLLGKSETCPHIKAKKLLTPAYLLGILALCVSVKQ